MPDGVRAAGDISGPVGRLETLAAEEGHTVEDLLHHAVRLYLGLPPSARRSIRTIDVLGGEGDHAAVGIAAGRAIVQVAFDVAMRKVAESGAKYASEHGLADEDAAIEEAVRITREAARAVA